MKNKAFAISGFFLATLAGLPLAMAAGNKAATSPSPAASESPAAKTEAPSTQARPFHGMISAVDQAAKTFTIAGKEKSRVFKVSDKTVMTKAGKPATMAEIVENIEVAGSYRKETDGSLEAKMVKLGPMNEKKAPDTAKKEKTASPSASASLSASPKKP